MIPEQYLRIAKRWFWLVALVMGACVAVSLLVLPDMLAKGPPGSTASVTLGVSRMVSASGSVTTAGGTGTPELLSSYTQSFAERGNTPQYLKELQDRVAAQGVVISTNSLASKVDVKADIGLFRLTITATDADPVKAHIIADEAMHLMIDVVQEEEDRVKAELTAITAAQQTQLTSQLNDVYTQRTARLTALGEPAIRQALDDLVRGGVGQSVTQTSRNLFNDLARIGSDPQLAVLNSQADSLEQQLATLADTQRSFSDQILQGGPLSIVDPTSTVQLPPPNALRTRDLGLMGAVAGLVLGWITAALVDGMVIGWRQERVKRAEWEAMNTQRIDRYFSHD